MQNKKTVPFIAIVAALTAVVAGLGFWLWNGASSRVAELRDQIAAKESAIAELKGAQIFPDESSISEIAKKNTELIGYLDPAVVELMSHVQVGTNLAGVDVQQRLRKLQEDLFQRAGKTNQPGFVKLPENFAFGFSRYLQSLPARDKVMALTLQFKLTDRLVNLLFASGIQSLDAFQRLPIEDLDGNKVGSDTANDTLAPINVDRPEAPFYSVPFVIKFQGGIECLRSFLGSVAKAEPGQPLFVVRSVSVKNLNASIPTIDSLKSGQGVEGAASAPAASTASAGDGTTNVLREMKPTILFGGDDELISCDVRLDYIEWKGDVQPKKGKSQ